MQSRGKCKLITRILLVILFPRDTAAVTALDSNDVWAFNEGMSRHDIWHLGVDQQYPPVMWRRGDVADNPAWRCTETRCNYSVQQRKKVREDDDRPGWPKSDVLVSPHVLSMAWV